jgi:hypothetical protein
MAKYGIGVGEEFPVDEPNNPPPPEDDDERRKMRRRWRRHHFLHLLTRIALIALVITGIAWLFRPHYFSPGPYAPYAFYPYPHHFFFPFFPVLLIGLLIAFAWRRGGCYGMRHHWHDHPHDDRREGA